MSDGEIAKAMLAGGMIGVFIATHWSFAAEVGGCQAEGGSASAMSAAAMVTFMGGDAARACGAASMAMQNMLGLICDPVANRVEVPCLGKNVLAASNALSCANMAIAGFDAVIPLDETIAAAKAVAERMPREHRCTALGGLAITPTSGQCSVRLRQCSVRLPVLLIFGDSREVIRREVIRREVITSVPLIRRDRLVSGSPPRVVDLRAGELQKSFPVLFEGSRRSMHGHARLVGPE